MQELADNNFKFDNNGRKFSKQVESTVGKREIACYEQFLLFPHCFQRLSLQTCKNQGLFGKGLSCIVLKVDLLSTRQKKKIKVSKLKAFPDGYINVT